MSNDMKMYNGYVDDDHYYIDEQPAAAAGGKAVFFPTCRFAANRRSPTRITTVKKRRTRRQRYIAIATRRGSIKTRWKRRNAARKISPAFANALTTL